MSISQLQIFSMYKPFPPPPVRHSAGNFDSVGLNWPFLTPYISIKDNLNPSNTSLVQMQWGYSEVRRVRLCRVGVSVQSIVLWRLYPELPLTAFCPALLVFLSQIDGAW